MSKVKAMSIALGLAIMLTPVQASSAEILDASMEDEIYTQTKEEVEFVSTIAEMAIEEKNKRVYLGEFTITHYCSCELCNGSWVDMPAKNGEPLKENYTIAVDPKVIPLNSFVEINGKRYKACDTGSAIKGNKIDIFVDDHKRCYELGKIKNVEVYLLKE